MSKPHLIFLHGTAGSSSDFDAQMRHFQPHWKCLSLTLKALSVKQLADEVQDQLNQQIPDASYILIGHSLGGLVALEMASRPAPGLKGIALLDTPMLMLLEAAEGMRPLADAFASDAYLPTLEAFANQYFFIDQDEPAIRKKLITRLLEFPKAAFNQLWHASGEYAAESAAKKVSVPMLYIHSGVPIDLEKLQALVPSVTIQKTTRGSHYSPLFSSSEINSFLDSFVKPFAS